jgi:RNA polymerase sigma-70 factor (ECF subfamily)
LHAAISAQYHSEVKAGGAASLCAVVLMFQVRRTGEGPRELTRSIQNAGLGEPDDRSLLDALRNRDPDALAILFARYHRSMVGLATLYVRNSSAAEEVVQDTWLAAIDALPKFEGRSSLRTWLFRILVKRASKYIRRETLLATILSRRSRSVRDALARRFTASGNWTVAPAHSSLTPEEQMLSREVSEWVRKAVASLPPRQREVIFLRDLEGWSSEEVCEVLKITSTHQRVLLHRARSALYTLYSDYISANSSQPRSGHQ